MLNPYKLILASSSPRRLALLKTVGIKPDKIVVPDIDEKAYLKEKPEDLTLRLAKEKVLSLLNLEQYENNTLILGADTIVSTKEKIFDKALSNEDVEKYLKFFSGRKIHIHTAVVVAKIQNNQLISLSEKLVTSKIKFKRISSEEMQAYIATGVGVGAAGGFAIQNFGEALLQWMHGSYSGIMGLPLTQTINLLKGLGYDFTKSKSQN